MNYHDQHVDAAVQGDDGVPRAIFNMLDKLTDEQRLSVFWCYCRACGSTDPECQCWNDE